VKSSNRSRKIRFEEWRLLGCYAVKTSNLTRLGLRDVSFRPVILIASYMLL
jgi:hypothetical protein